MQNQTTTRYSIIFKDNIIRLAEKQSLNIVLRNARLFEYRSGISGISEGANEPTHIVAAPRTYGVPWSCAMPRHSGSPMQTASCLISECQNKYFSEFDSIDDDYSATCGIHRFSGNPQSRKRKWLVFAEHIVESVYHWCVGENQPGRETRTPSRPGCKYWK